MRIEYLHASTFGNGAMVAAEFKRLLAGRGVSVEVHHIREVRPAELPPADLYLFSSPGRMGKPIRSMRRFLEKGDIAAVHSVRRPDDRAGTEAGQEDRADADRRRAVQVAA